MALFTKALHLYLPWTRKILSKSLYLIYLRSITLYSHLLLGLPSCLFPSDLSIQILYAPLLSSVHPAYPTYLILLDLLCRMSGEEHQLWSPPLRSLPQSPATAFIYTYIILSNLFQNTVRMCKSKDKGKILPITGHEGPEGEQMYSSTLPSTSAVDGGGWSMSRPGHFTPRKDPVPTV